MKEPRPGIWVNIPEGQPTGVVALQIGPEGYSWCGEPEVLRAEDVVGHRKPWPTQPDVWREDELPREFNLRLLDHYDVLALLSHVDEVIYAVEPDTDMRLAGTIDLAAANQGWSSIRVVTPHPGGAAGIMRDFITQTLEAAEPVPEEDIRDADA